MTTLHEMEKLLIRLEELLVELQDAPSIKNLLLSMLQTERDALTNRLAALEKLVSRLENVQVERIEDMLLDSLLDVKHLIDFVLPEAA